MITLKIKVKKMFKSFLLELRNAYFILNKNRQLYYFGMYPDWETAEIEALKFGNNYQDKKIFEKVIESTQKVRNHEAFYEQDGVPYYEENNNYPLLTAFFYILSESKKLYVTDFGGSLGSTFFRYQKLLKKFDVKWNICEQKHYVDYGIENIPEINFVYDFFDIKGSNVLLLSGVMSYVPDIYERLENMLDGIFDYVVIDEQAFSANDREEIRLQHVPSSIYSAVYPLRLFSLSKVMELFFRHKYHLVFSWNYSGGISIIEGNTVKSTLEKGFFFKLKK